MADLPPLHLVRQRWRNGEPAILAWLQSASLLNAELMASSGVDGVVIDCQHGLISFSEVPALILAIESGGAEAFVRPPNAELAFIGWCLDAGATGIIAPLIDSRRQAEDVAAAIAYPPLGRRSFGPRRYPRGVAASSTAPRDRIVLLAMIETRAGIADATQIAAHPGVDGVFIGPSDLALAIGEEPTSPPSAATSDASQQVRRNCQQIGAKVGIFCSSKDRVVWARQQGFDLITLPPDGTLVTSGTREALQAARS